MPGFLWVTLPALSHGNSLVPSVSCGQDSSCCLAPPQRALKVHNSCQFAPRLSLYQEGPVLDETLWKVVLKLPPDLNASRRFSSHYGAWYLGAKRPRYTEECWEWEDESFPEIFGPRVPAAYAVSAALGVRPERLYFIPGFREGHWRRPCLGWQSRREVERGWM